MKTPFHFTFLVLLLSGAGASFGTPSVLIVNPTIRHQEIDGFGSCLTGNEANQSWWHEMYLDTLGASMIRVDLVPTFRSPWSDNGYNSPWFRGRNVRPFGFNFEIDSSATPRHYTGPVDKEFTTIGAQIYYNGPDGNRARSYTSASDYGRMFGGASAPIAVMGPNIDDNIARCFEMNTPMVNAARSVVQAAKSREASLAHFKLIGSIWSPAPWLKINSGNVVGENYGFWPAGAAGTPFPFIAMNGNFVGGRLDVTNTPISAFNDSGLADDAAGPNATALRGNTSALTQFARSTAAYLRAFQKAVGTRFYAISIQNELNFETFYNSCFYQTAQDYLKASHAVRIELEKYEDLRDIRIMGPEDLLSDSTYSLWAYGDIDKNLKIVTAIEADAEGTSDVSLYSIHGYATDGVSASGADPIAWERWANGWIDAPAVGLPTSVSGFSKYGKKSWMTETSGEQPEWLSPSIGYPNNGAFSIALKIHQALTAGRESAWLYWQTTDGGPVGGGALTDELLKSNSPKFTAARHYFSAIRPGAVRVAAEFDTPGNLVASGYVDDANHKLTIVVLNKGSEAQEAKVDFPNGYRIRDAHLSSTASLWSKVTHETGSVTVALPGYSVLTLVGKIDAPAITVHPQSVTTETLPVTLSVSATGDNLTYEWYKDGLSVGIGASNSLNVVDAGDYFVRVSNDAGATTSRFARVVNEVPQDGPVVNLSVRGASGHSGEKMIAGFVVSGGARDILVRVSGPALGVFGLTNLMTDPSATIHSTSGGVDSIVGFNSNWGVDATHLSPLFLKLGAFAWTDTTSRDSALVINADGPRTAVVSNEADSASGVVLVEGYDAGTGGSGTLINISTRNYIGTGSDVLIVGFVIGGNVPKRVLIRAVGPTLKEYFDVTSALSDPVVELYLRESGGRNVLLATNDDWSSEPGVQEASGTAGAFLLPIGSADSALIITLPAGQYTGVARGANQGTGVALLEVYTAL